MADVTPSALTNAIMGKLYDVLTNGDATVPKSTDNFFSWCTPGIPVSVDDFRFLSQGLTGIVTPQAAASLSTAAAGGATTGTPTPLTAAQLNQLRAQDTNAVYQQAEMLARIVDFVPDLAKINNAQFAQFSVDNNEGTLSDRYALVLQMSQVMHQELTADQIAKIAQFRALMQTTTTVTDLVTNAQTQVVGPSPLVQAYFTKQAAYDAAALAYNMARIAALAATDPTAVQNFAINAPLLRNAVTGAMDDWITNGYKVDYEEMAAYISQVQARDMMLVKQQYEDDLAKATLTGISSGSDFCYTALAPADFATSTGWSKFTFSSGDFETYANSKYDSSGWQAQASGGFMGLFGASFNAGGTSATNSNDNSFNLDTFSLSFEICQIPIVRAWFKDSFLNSTTWRFDQTNPDFKNGAKNSMLSDGGSPPTGFLPGYPTGIVFIRNLYLTIDKTSSAASFIQQQQTSYQNGGGSVSLGFFSLGGGGSHYSNTGYSNAAYTATWDDQGLSVPGMQIAGFKCHVFTSKMPNPDPSITSWA